MLGESPHHFQGPLRVPAPLCCAVAHKGGTLVGLARCPSECQGCCSPRHASLEQGSEALLPAKPPELWRSHGEIPAAPMARLGQCPWHCDVAHSWCKVGVQRGAQTDYLCFVCASGLRVAGPGLEQGAGGWMWGSGRQMGLRPLPTCSHQAGLGVNPHHALPLLAAFPFWLLPSLFSRW